MRIFLITLLIAISSSIPVEANWFGKYNSHYEALEACQKWKGKGEKYTVTKTDKRYNKDGTPRYIYMTSEKNSRSCKLEKLTNQYLGFEEKEYGEKKVKKNFKY